MRRALPPLLALVLALVLLTGCEFSLERLAHGGALPPPPEDYTGLQDGFRYTKTTLTGQERYLYDQLLAGLQNQEETIGDLYPDTEMIQTAIDAIDRDYPELFWFSGTGQIETTLLAGKPLEAAYTPVYTMDQAQRQATQAQIDQWAADCFATIPQGASDYDKALGVFTYIIQHADYQVVDNNSIVNIMVGGAGLCGCYAKTTQYLLGLLGVDTAYITGQAQGESHAWNLAWLDGTPCWIDTTWGDPVFTGGDDSQGPAYEYFGLTTDDLLRTHTIDDKVPVPDCTSNSNNYFFRNGLYFSAYDPDALTALFQRALAAGQRQVSVRYADAAYPAACAELERMAQKADARIGEVDARRRFKQLHDRAVAVDLEHLAAARAAVGEDDLCQLVIRDALHMVHDHQRAGNFADGLIFTDHSSCSPFSAIAAICSSISTSRFA